MTDRHKHTHEHTLWRVPVSVGGGDDDVLALEVVVLVPDKGATLIVITESLFYIKI